MDEGHIRERNDPAVRVGCSRDAECEARPHSVVRTGKEVHLQALGIEKTGKVPVPGPDHRKAPVDGAVERSCRANAERGLVGKASEKLVSPESAPGSRREQNADDHILFSQRISIYLAETTRANEAGRGR